MFCSKCGAKNDDGAKFCADCGQPMAAPQPQPQPQPQPVQQPQQAQAAPYAQQTQQAYQAQPAQPAPTYVAPAPIAPTQMGCVSAAWNDIKSSPNWLKKVLLLGLLNCFPVLDLVVPGYALRWSRKLVFGENTPMPDRFFEDRSFFTGICSGVISLLVFFALLLPLLVLFMIPLVGWIAGIVLSVFVGGLAMAATMRFVITEDFGAAFDLRTVWDRFKAKAGTAVWVTYGPSLIVNLIVIAILVVVWTLFSAVTGVAVPSGPGRGGYSPAMNYVVGGFSIVAFFLAVASWIFCAFANALAVVLANRAAAHWAVRYASEWRSEAVEGRMEAMVDKKAAEAAAAAVAEAEAKAKAAEAKAAESAAAPTEAEATAKIAVPESEPVASVAPEAAPAPDADADPKADK